MWSIWSLLAVAVAVVLIMVAVVVLVDCLRVFLALLWELNFG
jgi:hypothetical protein